MDHAEKLRRMEAHLVALGVKRAEFAPPLYRLAWRGGIDATPPLFAGFTQLALTQGLAFATGWGGAMWLLVWSRDPVYTPVLAVVGAASAGLAFGVVMAFFVRGRARALRLPPWADYVGPPEGPIEPPRAPRSALLARVKTLLRELG